MSALLLYASVTGKAESIAHLIAEEAEKKGRILSLKCMSDPDVDLRQENCLLIVSSTTGDGEQPEQAIPFLRHLSAITDLRHLEFTVLGLGDTNYSQFCNAPKTLFSRLTKLGAKVFYDPGWADDGTGLEVVVEPWIEGLWDSLPKASKRPAAISKTPSDILAENTTKAVTKKHRKMDGIRGDLEDNLRPLKCKKWIEKLGGNPENGDVIKKLAFADDVTLTVPSAPAEFLTLNFGEVEKEEDDGQGGYHVSPHFKNKSSKLHSIQLASGIKMTKNEAVKDAFKITLEMDDEVAQDLALEPGDAVDIVCGNPETEVDALLDCLGVDPDYASAKCVTASLLPNCKKSAKIPEFLSQTEKMSLKQIFAHGVEIRSVPKKPMVRMLVDHTLDKVEKRRLEELCSRQGGSAYLSAVRAANLCLLDILLAFPTCQPPIERVLEHLPPLQARPYSVASWQNLKAEISGKRSYDVVFSLVEIEQKSGRQFPRQGVSTRFLKSLCDLKSTEHVSIYKRIKKSFRPPMDLTVPYVMIGAGTGVAPFRGFMQERAHAIESHQNPDQVATAWLVYGCRNKDKDFLFESEWNSFDKNFRFDVCFSRDGGELKYVQDVLRENAALFVENVLTENAMIFVCGDALSMAKDVQETVIDILHKNSDLTEAQAKDKIADMRLNETYLQDIWT